LIGAGKASLSRPNPCVQPEKDQSSPRGHEADAQTLTGLPHSVQRQREPHHDEAGQGQDVHAEENVPGEHCPLLSVGSCLRVPTLPLWLGRATVSNSLASGRCCRLSTRGRRGALVKALVRHGINPLVAARRDARGAGRGYSGEGPPRGGEVLLARDPQGALQATVANGRDVGSGHSLAAKDRNRRGLAVRRGVDEGRRSARCCWARHERTAEQRARGGPGAARGS
jgi:hypothetical protein